MFPIQQRIDPVVIEDPLLFEQDKLLEELLADNTSFHERRNTKKRGRKPSKGHDESIDGAKRMMHRDIERQRRQEMAKLYSSLRALLPPQFIKGKRSICDHMYEAVNYIKSMQNNIKELSLKKEKLKKMARHRSIDEEKGDPSRDEAFSVALNPYQDRLEILISSKLKEKPSLLSRVLVELLERKLTVINCISTIANDKSLHSIQFQADDLTCIDLSALHESLTDVISCGLIF